MGNSFLDSDSRFLSPNFDNSSVSAINAVLTKLDFLSNPTSTMKINSNNKVEELWKLRGKPDKVKSIVLIIADSLGIANIHETGVLKNYLETNISVDASFPTMTSTNMASLSHVQYPSTHGLVGYNIFHEKIGGIFNSLNCRTMSNNKKNVPIQQLNINKQDIMAGDDIFTILKNHANICMQELYSEVWVPDLFDMSGLPNYLFGKSAPTYTYNSFDPKKMLQELYHHLFNSTSLNIITIYFPHTDFTSHVYTAQSQEYFGAMKLLEKIIQALERHPTVSMGETAIVVTSDHGQVRLPKGSQNVKVSNADVQEHANQGFSIGTSGRTLHVYYKSEVGQRNSEQYLSRFFSTEQNGIIIDQKDALKLLGPTKPSPNILQRLGQKVVIIDEGFYLDYPEVVLYGEGKDLLAQHGGLSRNELKVPFFII